MIRSGQIFPLFRWVVLAGIVLSVPIALSGCSSASQSPEEYIQKAKDLNAQGQHNAALIELRNVLQQQPNHPQANWLIAETYLAMGNPFMAETALRKASEGGVSDQVLKLSLAKSLYLQGRADEALKVAEPGVEDSLDLRLKLMAIQGESLMAMNRLEAACTRFEEMRQLKSDSSSAALGLSRCAAARQDFALSRKLTEDAISFDPKNPEAWVQLGHTERGQDRLLEAEIAYGKALELAPSNINALLGRAMARLKLRKFDDAQKDLKVARAAAPSNPTPTHLLGVEAFFRGNHQEAKTHFQTVLKAIPGHLTSLYWQGITDIYLGNMEQAVKALSQYTAQRPGDAVARIILASALARQGNRISAEESLKALRSLGVENPSLLGMTGQTYLAIGKSVEAQRYLRMALDNNPKDVSLKLLLAESYRQQRQYDAYLKELAEAVALNPQSMPLRGQFAQALIAQGKPDRARAEIAEMRRLAPKSTEPLTLQAALQLRAEDWVGARKSFETMLRLEPDSATAHLNLSRLDLREGKFDAARNRFLALLQRDAGNITALTGLAALAYARNDLKAQREWLEKALKVNPNAIEPLMHLAQNLLATGNTQQALSLARQAHAAEPNNPATLQLLGDVQLAGGEPGNARSSFAQWAELQPNSAAAFFKLALANDAAGLARDAKQAMLKAISLSPRDMTARLTLARWEARGGNFAEAHKLAAAIKQDFPKQSAGYLLAGEIFLAEKKLAEARKQFEQGITVQPTAILLMRMANLQLAQGAGQSAAQRLQQWVNRHPEDQVVRMELAGMYARLNKLDLAIAEYETLLKRNPDHVALLNDLAWLLQKQGAMPRARTLAEQALKLAPNNPAIQDTLGWILVQQGQTKRGLDLLAQAAQSAPRSSGIQYRYAAALVRTGDKSGARRVLEKLLAENAPFSERQEAEALLRTL